MNINYQSDFKIVERLMPDAPFRFTYYIGKDRGSVTAEYDGQSYSGCFVDGDRLIVPVDGGTLGIGSVRVKREYFLDDKAFADGVCNLVSVEGTDIELGRGRTDSDIEADVEVGVYYKAFTFDDMTEEQKQEIADRVPTKEAEREKAETQRVEAESARVEAEKKRAAAEAARQATFSTNEKARQTTFSTNEEARQSVFNANEEKREEAEAKREERTDEAIASIANKVDRTDNAPELTAGFAGNLVGRGEATSEEIGFRPSGGLTSVDDGAARIERLKGNTLVWNQIYPTGWTSVEQGVRSVSSDGIISLNGTATNIYFDLKRGVCIPYAHKGLYHLDIINDDSEYLQGKRFGLLNRGLVVAIEGKSVSFLYVNDNETSQWGFGFSGTAIGDTITDVKIRIAIYDLTQMFGAGNEPTTIEEFNARKPLGIDEYAYNEGELISTTADEIKSVGFNAWDEEWEIGSLHLNVGSNDNETSDSIRSKGYTKVLPNTTYFAKTPQVVQSYFVVVEYDEDKKFIRHIPSGSANKSFVTSSTCRYIRFRLVGTNHYNNDICIHLVHTGYRNGEYEPYEEFRRSLPISEIKDSEGNALFPNGLLSAGSVYDEITETKAIKRIGMVDMGTLTWAYSAIASHERMFSQSIKDLIKHTPNSTTLGNILCVKYTTGIANDSWFHTIDNVIASDVAGYIYVYSTTMGTSETAFKASLQGVMLYYELAEPIEVDLPEPINMDYEVSDFGTEEVLSDTPTTPLKADIIYQFNAVDRIRENSLFLEDLIKRVAALEAQNAALVQQLNATGNGETE